MRQLVTAVADATGTATATFRPRSTYTCRVSQVSVEMTQAPGSASCALRLDGVLVTPLVPQADAASGDPTIDVDPADELSVVWTNVTVGITGAAAFFYDQIGG